MATVNNHQRGKAFMRGGWHIPSPPHPVMQFFKHLMGPQTCLTLLGTWGAHGSKTLLLVLRGMPSAAYTACASGQPRCPCGGLPFFPPLSGPLWRLALPLWRDHVWRPYHRWLGQETLQDLSGGIHQTRNATRRAVSGPRVPGPRKHGLQWLPSGEALLFPAKGTDGAHTGSALPSLQPNRTWGAQSWACLQCGPQPQICPVQFESYRISTIKY